MRFKSSSLDVPEREFKTLQSQVSDAQRFADTEPFRIRCRTCGAESVFDGVGENQVCRRSASCSESCAHRGCFAPGWCSVRTRLLLQQQRMHGAALARVRRRAARHPAPTIHRQVLRGLVGLRRDDVRQPDSYDVGLRQEMPGRRMPRSYARRGESLRRGGAANPLGTLTRTVRPVLRFEAVRSAALLRHSLRHGSGRRESCRDCEAGCVEVVDQSLSAWTLTGLSSQMLCTPASTPTGLCSNNSARL
jgi:hypothetical protein